MVCIYILKLQNNKYYVGRTKYKKLRLQSHFNNMGSAWTKKYKPIEIYKIYNNCDNYDEDKYTIKYMQKFGIENVRGGSFCQIKLPNEIIITINKMINTTGCYKCGSKFHYIRNCNVYNEIYFYCSICNKKFKSNILKLKHENICYNNDLF